MLTCKVVSAVTVIITIKTRSWRVQFSRVQLLYVGPIKQVLRENRQEVMKQCTKECNEALAKNAIVRVHSQDLSFSKHTRQRLATYFDAPQSVSQKKKARTALSANDCQTNEQFDTICHKLRNWPADKKFVATEIAKEFEIKRSDASHKIKLLALDLKANIAGLTLTAKPKSTLKRFQNSHVSMPAPPSYKKLKKQEKELIESKEIDLGTPCCPLPVTYYRNGEMYEKTAIGRKFSLLELRQKLLSKQRELMRLHLDCEIARMSKEDILDIVSKVASCAIHNFESLDLAEMQQQLKHYERTRALWIWSDHSVVESYGLVLIIAGVIYDPLVFYTDPELAKSPKTKASVQELVEQGEIYIMTHCSSSSADQAGLTPEKVACLDSLSEAITTEDGIEIHDTLQFFKGDKQSAWFEAGIQRGGHYCCIACNCHTNDCLDFTKAHHSKLRGYRDIQHTATAGIFGKVPNKVNFYDTLNSEQLKRELVSRGIFEFPSTKKSMVDELKGHLCGVQGSLLNTEYGITE